MAKCCSKPNINYSGGVAKCSNCKKYHQPDGRVTKTPTGRTKKK